MLNGNSTTNNGNLTGQNIITQNPTASFNQSYTYDALNRIASAGESGAYAWSEGFNADRYGNLWLSNLTGNIPTQPLMPSSQSFFNASTNQLTNVTYGPAGNQLAFGSFGLNYDAEGRQILALQSESPPVTYAYDGLGERVSKSLEGGLTTMYVHDVFGNLAAEYTTGGTGAAPPCTTCYLSWDHLGSTRMMTDQNGVVQARHDYLPFGVEIPANYAGRSSAWGTADNVTAKFTGQERDTETGLDFFQARYHGSAQGRFLSPDPLGNFVATAADPQSWNMYAYARNNPLSLVDPTGLDYCSDEGYDINSGDVSEEDCYQIGGTWNPDAVFVTNVDQYNGDQATSYGDDSGGLDGSGPSVDALGQTFSVDAFGRATSGGSGPTPCTDQNATGFGFGVIGSTGALGGLGHGFGATGSLGVGVFQVAGAGRTGSSVGMFGSGGAFLAPHGSIGNYPSNNTTLSNVAAGASIGAGVGGFITNAGNANALGGQFTTVQLNLPFVSIEADFSKGIYFGSATVGPARVYQFSAGIFQTNTPLHGTLACGF